MRRISAAEIGTYLFCARAWWYRNQGIETGNIEELAGGRELHHQHSRAVLTSSLLRMIAYLTILAALILFSVNLVLLVV